MKLDIKSIVNEVVENAVVGSQTIGALIKNVQVIAEEMTRIFQVLIKVNERLNKHEEAILQLSESQSVNRNSEKDSIGAFDLPKSSKSSQKPN